MVTYDILILISIAVLIIGIHIGLLISTYIFEKLIEKSKAKRVDKLVGTEMYRCPNCKKFLSQKYEYCHKCGQKVDFRGVGE